MSAPPGQLYFAYGSNLWLHQMASRCPNSYYIGRGILPDHRWQINVRGFANVIPCSGYTVHGLVYQISAKDEARLDRNEGIHSGAYSKEYKSIILHAALPELQLPTRQLAENEGPEQAIDSSRRGSRRDSRRNTSEQEPFLRSNVLVYLSETFVRGGTPKEEYINRMNYGIRDALTFGVPLEFVDIAIRPSIPNMTPPRKSSRRARHRRREDSRDVPDARERHSSLEIRGDRRPQSHQRSWVTWATVQQYKPSFGFGRSLSSWSARPYQRDYSIFPRPR